MFMRTNNEMNVYYFNVYFRLKYVYKQPKSILEDLIYWTSDPNTTFVNKSGKNNKFFLFQLK